MKKYYKVSFQYSESVYCANIAHAETAADVEAHYSKYAWYSVKEAAAYEVEEATRKGMPIIEIEPAKVEEEEQEENTMKENIIDQIKKEVEARTERSAWSKGVTAYAREPRNLISKRGIGRNTLFNLTFCRCNDFSASAG